jgi:hypothetical protein
MRGACRGDRSNVAGAILSNYQEAPECWVSPAISMDRMSLIALRPRQKEDHLLIPKDSAPTPIFSHLCLGSAAQ